MNAHDAICKAAHDALCSLRIPHADHIWVSPVPFFDDVTAAIEAALSANGYTITLTDDGAALPVRRDGEGALAAAPSSPRITDEAVEAAAKAVSVEWQHFVPSMRLALEAALPHLEGATPVADKTGYNALAPWLEEVFSTGTEEGITWEDAAKALFACGAVREGAAPAIDREALEQAIERAAVAADLAKYFRPGDMDKIVNEVMALIGGAS